MGSGCRLRCRRSGRWADFGIVHDGSCVLTSARAQSAGCSDSKGDMSKKDLLERLSRRRTGDSSRKPVRNADSGTRVAGDAVTKKRVSRNVVRRRSRVDASATGTGKTVVRRRKAPEAVEAAPPAPTAEAPAAPPEIEAREESRQMPEAAAPPVDTTSDAPIEVAAPPVALEPSVEESVAAPEPAAEPAAEAAPAEAAAASAEPAPAEVTAPEPQQVIAEAPAIESSPREEPKEVAAGESPEPAAAAAETDEQGGNLPKSARFAGLGKAVVMPPPGYDPTNPAAFRRTQDLGRSAGAPARRAPGSPAGTDDAANKTARGRRRVDHGPGRGPARRPSRGPRGDRGGGGFPGRTRGRRRRKSSGPKKASPAPKAEKRKVRVDNVISVKQLAHELGVKAPLVIRHLMDLGRMATVNEMLDVETATLIASEFEYEVENVGFQEENYLQHVDLGETEEEGDARPPVVTVMGHVDHGKTTLLDAIRSSRVASGEAGGITQHIGAYQVSQNDDVITFLDTPGHEAFTAMRAQGAGVTDLVVLVVAADDGVQPQTVEAINHAKAADVPIIVAVNKMDKPGVTADPIMQRLTEHGLVSEEWGGDTMFVQVSALTGDGLDELLEAISLQSEMLELLANPDRHAEGTVIEAKMERGRGAVATVLVQRGTLKRGDHVVLGSAFGKVRALIDHRGKRIKEAGPSTPVFLFGLSELPEVGDSMAVVANEKNARKLAEHRAQEKRSASMVKNTRMRAEDLFAAAQAEQREQLLLILKADVQGTLQALKASIEGIEVEGAEVRILHAGVGDISESDVTLASSDDALLIGFNVRLDAKARGSAIAKGVDAEIYSVIYDVLDRIERQMKGLLAPTYELVRRGSAEVRLLFKISRIGTVAGSYVLDGTLGRNHMAKVLRRGELVWEGPVKGLKRFKDDVKEVGSGFECGISLEGFDDVLEGDIVETYSRELVERD